MVVKCARLLSFWRSYFTLPTVAVLSLLVSLLAPSSDHSTNDERPFSAGYKVAHDWLGWTYFFSWSLSFYPQLFLNVSRKTTIGLSPDFAVYNFVGFFCYSIYTCGLHYNSAIMGQYSERHEGMDPSVSSQDVFFALHAVILSLVGILQICYYDGLSVEGLSSAAAARHREGGGANVQQRLTRMTFILCSCCASFVIGYAVSIATLSGKVNDQQKASRGLLNSLDYVYALSYIKVFITVIKYIPQVHSNYARKSTKGWNIWNVLLDFSGGVFSAGQLIGDAIEGNGMEDVSSNKTKVALGLVSIVFDIIFMVQHYGFYGREKEETVNIAPGQGRGMYFSSSETQKMIESGRANSTASYGNERSW